MDSAIKHTRQKSTVWQNCYDGYHWTLQCFNYRTFTNHDFRIIQNTRGSTKFNLELPTQWMFSNYAYVFKEGGIGKAMMNSVIVTVVVTLLTIVSGGLCAFIISRRNGRYTSGLYNLFLLGMISPMQVVTTFALLKMIHLTGTYTGVIFVETAIQLPWAIFMFTGFIKGVPRELDEAAYIDGARPLTMFLK